MRSKYRVTVTFTYSNGTPGGVLTKVVAGQKQVKATVDNYRQWLARKGHSMIAEEIKNVS